MVILNDENIQKIYVGNQIVSKVYIGNNLVYEQKEDDTK